MAPDPEGDAPLEEAERPDPGIPWALKAIWAAFAIWAAAYFVLYLVPEFGEWRAGR